MKNVIGLMLFLFLNAPAAWAQSSCQSADNLVLNCGFDSDVNGWAANNGFVSHDPVDGAEQSGALQIETFNGTSRTTQSACVNTPIDGGRQYDFGASYRVVSNDLLNFCRVDVTEFDSAGCTGNQTQHLATSQGFPSMSASFSNVASEFTTQTSALSLRIRLDCDQNFGTHTVNWDDVILRERVEPPPEGNFVTVPLDPDLTPLEVDMGLLGPPGTAADLLIVQLWNNVFDDNRLTAYRVPAPYDGSGVTSTEFDGGSLFGLNLCVLGQNQAVVVYTKDFNTRVAQYDGTSWSTDTLPQTVADEYHYADCALTSSGVVVQALNATQNRLDIYKRAQIPLRSTKGVFDEFKLAFSLGSESIPGGPLSPFFGGIPPKADSEMDIFDLSTTTDEYALLAKASSDSVRRIGSVDATSGAVSLQSVDVSLNRGGSSADDSFDYSGGTGRFNQSSAAAGASRLADKGQVQDDRGRQWLAVKSGGVGLVFRIAPGGEPEAVNLGASSQGLFARNRLAIGVDGYLYRFARRAFAIDRDTLAFAEIGAYPFSAGGGLGDLLMPFNTILLAGNANGLSLSVLRPDVAFVSNFD